jgi:hypothetical protein
VGLSTHSSLWPFLHTQSQTHAVFLGVKEQNILALNLKLTLFFGCEGGKYPHTQTQTHAVFLCGFEYARFTLAFSFPALVSQRGLSGSEV